MLHSSQGDPIEFIWWTLSSFEGRNNQEFVFKKKNKLLHPSPADEEIAMDSLSSDGETHKLIFYRVTYGASFC